MSEGPEPLDLRSFDVAASRREELLRIFPEARTEDEQIDFERLRLALGEEVDTGRERFEITWPGKAACFRAIQSPSLATLRPAPAESLNFHTADHLIIEGDNLEVLKLLQKSYLGAVKMIYIDPPYNTGHDFIYPDNYADNLQSYLEGTGQVDNEGRRLGTNTEATGRFHSRWLSMMYPRLYLSRHLLRDDGVIFISIDDGEQPVLRKMCDEIFGEENHIATCIWQHSIQPKGYSGRFSLHHNYILAYQKGDTFELQDLDRTEEHNRHYSNPDRDPKGPWRAGDVRNALYRRNLRFDITTPSGKTIAPPRNGWRWSKRTIREKIDTGEIVFSDDESRIIRKIYLAGLSGRAPETIWFGKEVGTTRDAASELKDLFGGDLPFDTPKPKALIRRMLRLAGVTGDDLVLDYFAGSGSTADALLTANQEDGASMRYILVQLPELTGRDDYSTIADITKERMRRAESALAEQESESGVSRPPSQVSGFRVFRLAESNFNAWDAEEPSDVEALRMALEAHVDHIRKDRSALDLLYEILLKSGYELTVPVEVETIDGKTVYNVDGGSLLVFLEGEPTLELVRSMAARRPQRVVMLDRGFAGNDQLKANAAQTLKVTGAGEGKQIVFRTV